MKNMIASSSRSITFGFKGAFAHGNHDVGNRKVGSFKILKISLTILAALSTPAMAENLVVNGGFETGTMSGWTLNGNTSNSTVFSFGYEGSHSYGNGASSSKAFLSQNLTTTAGAHFAYSFVLLSAGGTPNEFYATLGGTEFGPSYINADAFGYTVFSGSVVAPTSNATLTFAFRQDPHFWVLDAVSITAVPEPASWALMVCGLGFAGVALRRRKPAPH